MEGSFGGDEGPPAGAVGRGGVESKRVLWREASEALRERGSGLGRRGAAGRGWVRRAESVGIADEGSAREGGGGLSQGGSVRRGRWLGVWRKVDGC